MNNIFLASETFVYLLLIIPIAIILILVVVASAIRFKKYRDFNKEVDKNKAVDPEQQEIFFKSYGGKDNIINVSHELSRITVEVKDIELVNLESLQALGAKGVLVMGNTVKASFGDRASYVYNILK